jgi:AcrR family transcriptional regulator
VNCVRSQSEREPDLESLRIAALPQAVLLAWGLGVTTNRGPKPTQSTERVVAAAIRLADDEGLGALSMAAVAKPLGLAATALYRYVDSKEILIELMVDSAVGHPPAMDAPGGWSENARVWARALLGVYARHPWLSDVVVTGMPRTPNSLEWIEALLAGLADSPLAESERLSAALLLQGIVRNYAAMIRSIPVGTDANASFVSLLPTLGARAYPRLIAELQRQRESVSDEFGFALDTTIRGLASPR